MNLPPIIISSKAHYISFAEDINIFDLFKKIRARYPTCFLAESLGAHGATDRYSLIGFAPKNIIRAKGHTLFVDDTPYEVANPYEALRAMMPQNCIARRYAGGLFGYLSYEALNYLEPSVKVKIHPRFDQFLFGVYTDGLVHDTQTNQTWYFYYDENRCETLQKLLAEPLPATKLPTVTFVGDTLNQTEHQKIVENIKNEIICGNTFQCEAGFKSEYKINGPAIEIYSQLRSVNPSPYMYYFQHNDLTILGASPELLLRVTNKFIETAPLAGTIRRGQILAEDKLLARKLLNDPKEVAEHVMLVDMHRNDIGRVAKIGSVKVAKLMDIKQLSHVMHMESVITGILQNNCDMFDALKSLLPGGVLSGAPKIESIKIIDRNEPEARGPYGGAIGSFGFNGDATFAIPIRSLYIKGNYAYTQTSSGIVYDSEPDKEYQEIQNKLAAMRAVLNKFAL